MGTFWSHDSPLPTAMMTIDIYISYIEKACAYMLETIETDTDTDTDTDMDTDTDTHTDTHRHTDTHTHTQS